MGEWYRLFRRLRDLVNPPRYPEYEEYRDDPGGGESGAAGASSGVGDDVARMRRLQVVAVFAVLLSGGVGAWIYFGDRTERPAGLPSDPLVRDALTSQVLQGQRGLDGEGVPPRDSLDDIKRWASDLERRVERTVDLESGVPPVATAPGSLAPTAPYYGQGYDPARPLVLPEPISYSLETPPASLPAAASATSSPRAGELASPYRNSNSTTFPATDPPARASAPPATEPAASADSGADNPYRRRSLEPVIYTPRSVDPY